LVIAEAWSAGTPVVVNATCGATTEHCRRSGGGLFFHGYAEFEVIIERLCADDELASELGRRGRSYVDGRFRWPIIIDRYATFLESVAAGTGGSDAGTQ
jgi:glycosyltransferase involved in cell wall biosynthesis